MNEQELKRYAYLLVQAKEPIRAEAAFRRVVELRTLLRESDYVNCAGALSEWIGEMLIHRAHIQKIATELEEHFQTARWNVEGVSALEIIEALEQSLNREMPSLESLIRPATDEEAD